ncbi:MAG: glutathione S-transferase N-terminal domain-containing protein [Burkholderiales bacterium]|jgi:glutathione S-transferase|nr:glutathione S-transferase N-terminal domain-containing protein [Burkholderiales bacterium]MBP6250087.1 glutathione S-transferase N-terminal domain-containing protein [Leptothrix sp. (in: b-proteobacteria)]MBP7521327.1 glutathione S-transferase N-terminal domain-containing protein [Leptothrix sp. (in: b-proteobacteria)]HQY08844.1 glutathione S-transferase N-terminal domain-containing protein [Burkholderiaceae bacterium]
MRLIGSLTSPYVRKVRVVLAEKKLDYKFELDDPWSADNQVSASNPLGKVPCLVLEGGEALFDSRVIVEYVDTLSPVGRLIPERGRERAEVRTWEALADGVMDAAITARMERHWPGRDESQRCQPWIDRQMGKVDHSLASMSRALGERPWCVGVYMSLADIACGCALGYLDFRFPDIDWRSRHANLAKLADKLGQRPGFIATAAPSA